MIEQDKGVFMNVIELQGSFGIEQLKHAEREKPAPGPGQVLLKMKAVSLNYRDLLMIKGHYNPKQPLPLIPCSDGVVEVVELGERVQRVKVGDRVSPNFAPTWLNGPPNKEKARATLGGPLDGTLTQYMLVDAESLVKHPKHLSNEECATLPCAALTAWSALVTQNKIRAGESVLVQGTGGVSLFALQFAKIMGARVIVTSSSNEKLEKAIELGADEGINYKEQPEWGKIAKKIAGGEGVDHIIEVGGAETLKQSLRAVKIGGNIMMIGVLSGVQSKVPLTSILMNQIRVQGILVGHREGFEAMNRAITHHQLHPVVDRVFSWQDIQEAFRYLESAKHFGKICVSIDS